MTAVEVAEKYGEVELHFTSYYKYVFSYRGVAEDGYIIVADYGGDHDDIYRYEVAVNSPEKLGQYFPEDDWSNWDAGWRSVTVFSPNGEEVFADYSGW